MKIDRQRPDRPRKPARSGSLTAIWRAAGWVALLLIPLIGRLAWGTDTPLETSGETATAQARSDEMVLAESQPKAVALLRRVIEQLAHGPAFDAKVRERVWSSGREVVGVGTYEQAGEGTGRFNLQITMHDGDGKHTLQQISDGRLAWTRTQIAEEISLSRVDVGRLDEWGRQAGKSEPRVAPRLRVGGWTEMLDRIEHDYVLRMSGGTLQLPAAADQQDQPRPVWILTGRLRDEVRDQMLQRSGREQWPPLCPTGVRVAIASTPDETTGFGKGLPVYLEFWSDPRSGGETTDEAENTNRSNHRHLISLIELYSIRPISSPPVARFRFDHQDVEVNFINETDRYLKRYGLQMTQRHERRVRR